MSAPEPPFRCPCCEALPEKKVEKWREDRAGAKTIRYPTRISITYLCGGAIQTVYIVKAGLRGFAGSNGNQAYWETQTIAGCRNAMARIVQRRGRA